MPTDHRHPADQAHPTTESRPPTVPARPEPETQAEQLIELGLAAAAGISAPDLRAAATGVPAEALLVLAALPVTTLTRALRYQGKPAFVVADMSDVDRFTPIEDLDLPGGECYAVTDLDRGDQLRNWSPVEALPQLRTAGRSPLTLAEGLHWLLQQPQVLVANHCFMTIGSRLRKAGGKLDARTPALWISAGTGRDGKQRKGAAKVGWCWARNRHTWLGFASAAARHPVPPT
ncbi:MAG TPA: DUF5701 family protein [Beutenbergiaceae bacterium]|nr:DUF5701 family protein [Beutenbergiaceae bacterium]